MPFFKDAEMNNAIFSKTLQNYIKFLIYANFWAAICTENEKNIHFSSILAIKRHKKGAKLR